MTTTILNNINNLLLNIFDKLSFDKQYAFFKYSDREDLSDFQTNCAFALAKQLKKNPKEIANTITEELNKSDYFSNITVDGAGFINIKIADNIVCNFLNETFKSDKIFIDKKTKNKKVIVDFGGYNIAKEAHVGHLRSTVIGESIRRIYEFSGDTVISDVHLGDWGLNMGMTIQGIKLKYPNLECFREDFSGDNIRDFNTTPRELTELYRLANEKAKTDEEFSKEVHLTTKKLQDGHKGYNALWKYFRQVCIDELKHLTVDILGAKFDYWNGESTVHPIIIQMIRNLLIKKQAVIDNGAKVIDMKEFDMPPFIIEKSDGAVMYSSSDMATIIDRMQKFNPDLITYVVDYRQSFYFEQLFKVCRKVGVLNDKCETKFCGFGTMNGKDNKPYKTRSGEIVSLKFLIEETINKIKEKSSNSSIDNETINNIAVACIKFADLINYRESSYIFNLEQFTNYEGKTGAYLLYGIVRINSILKKQEQFEYKITDIKTNEEKQLLIELSKFDSIFNLAYSKESPNIIAEYTFNLVKKFNNFYNSCHIDNEQDLQYKKSKISIIVLVKKYIETCLYLLGIRTVEKM